MLVEIIGVNMIILHLSNGFIIDKSDFNSIRIKQTYSDIIRVIGYDNNDIITSISNINGTCNNILELPVIKSCMYMNVLLYDISDVRVQSYDLSVLNDTLKINVTYDYDNVSEKELKLYFYHKGYILEFIDIIRLTRPNIDTTKEYSIEYYFSKLYRLDEDTLHKSKVIGIDEYGPDYKLMSFLIENGDAVDIFKALSK